MRGEVSNALDMGTRYVCKWACATTREDYEIFRIPGGRCLKSDGDPDS